MQKSKVKFNKNIANLRFNLMRAQAFSFSTKAFNQAKKSSIEKTFIALETSKYTLEFI
jgi:hypothetical protein